MAGTAQITAQDSTSTEPTAVKTTSNALWTTAQTTPGSEVNPSSSTNGWDRVYSQANATLNSGTSAIAIGGGASNDTMVLGVLILKNAGPATCTLAGFGKSTDGVAYTAANIVLTGSTSVDTLYSFPGGLVNNVGALTFTGSVDVTSILMWRPI